MNHVVLHIGHGRNARASKVAQNANTIGGIASRIDISNDDTSPTEINEGRHQSANESHPITSLFSKAQAWSDNHGHQIDIYRFARSKWQNIVGHYILHKKFIPENSRNHFLALCTRGGIANTLA